MNCKLLLVSVFLFAFSISLFASPATYSFSSFGGGLPSSVKKISSDSSSGKATSKRIIIEDDDLYDSDYESPYTNSERKTPAKSNQSETTVNVSNGAITTCLVGGLVLAAGIYLGSVYFTAETAECCEIGLNEFSEACAEELAEYCAELLCEACTSETTECSTELVQFLFGNGLRILPIYVP